MSSSSGMITTCGYGSNGPTEALIPMTYKVPWGITTDSQDSVHIKVYYCGVCHSDIHMARNEWKGTSYPIVPGHEMTGEVVGVGSAVTKFKVGDKVGVGCFVGSCKECDSCKADKENYCVGRWQTYNYLKSDGTRTKGGYGKDIVVPEHFCLRIPENLPMDAAAPLLCAGTTTFSGIKAAGLDKPGKFVGVAGIGGLGHIALLILSAMGVRTCAISSGDAKRDDAKKLGADEYINSKDPESMAKFNRKFDGIIYTIPSFEPLPAMMELLKVDGTKLVVLGSPDTDHNKISVPSGSIVPSGRCIMGSMVGGLKETQEMLDFCAEHKVVPWIENLTLDQVNAAFERTITGKVRYRCVLNLRDYIQ